MFNPSRLVLARKRRGLTQVALASLIGVTRLTIHRHETGETEPSEEYINILSDILKFPVEFFSAADIDEPNRDSASFRSLTSMPAGDRDSALAAGALAFLLDDWVNERFDLPAVDLLDLSGEEPETAARALRQSWALGERPIKNMVNLLEAKGVRVFSLFEDTQKIDAFSLWRNTTPYVFLNSMKTSERSRFDAAHELGHLAMHKRGGPKGRAAEEEAQRFASAFLMPTSDVVAVMPSASNVQQIIHGKKRWGVAAIALNYRLHKLGCISEWQYRRFAIQLTRLGYRTGEPGGLPPEKSIVWQKILTALREDGITKGRLAQVLALPVFEIENLLFRLTSMMSLDGGREMPNRGQAHLRLIDG